MPSSMVQNFTDPDHYAAAVRATNAQLTVVTRGAFSAKLTRIALYYLWMQRFSEDLPRVVHSAAGSDRAGITFQTQPGPSLRWNRMELDPTSIVRISDGHDAFQRSCGPTSFAAMSLPRDRFLAVGVALAGCDLTPPRSDMLVKPRPIAMAKLQHLHATIGHLAEHDPDSLVHPEKARGLEQALIEAMVRCLSGAQTATQSSAGHRHAAIMRKFHAVIAERPGEAIYIPDLCAAMGVPQRTLNACCHQSLGVGPKRFLLNRRMHLARGRLAAADAKTTTVTQIAADYGFWNFGRFAVEYRALFGEGPSATLLRTA